MVDITNLIHDDHGEQRKMFALLDEMPREDREKLAAVWHRLAVLLEVHAEAEEKLFYPHLLQVGEGALGHSSRDETQDAVHDHNQIRDALKKAGSCEAGTDDWWSAVLEARKANSTHMGEEEREALADFQRHASPQLRHDLGVEFAAFEAANAAGVAIHDKDPTKYVAERTS